MTRKRRVVQVTLSTAAILRVDEMATRCGETRSGMIERLIRDGEMPRPLLDHDVGRARRHRGR